MKTRRGGTTDVLRRLIKRERERKKKHPDSAFERASSNKKEALHNREHNKEKHHRHQYISPTSTFLLLRDGTNFPPPSTQVTEFYRNDALSRHTKRDYF